MHSVVLPSVIPAIVAYAVQLLAPRKIWLFGSRARGDNRPQSDIDLAFAIPEENQHLWAQFASWVDEDAPTLLHIDLVNIDTCAADLRAEIIAHGRVLYE